MLGFYVFPSMMMWSLPSLPPSEIHPGSLLQTNILPVSSLFSSYMPPLRPFLCIQSTLLQCMIPLIVRPPSSVCRRATNPLASADQCPLLVSWPSVPYAGLHPPPPDLCGWWYLAWVWVGGQRRRRPPRWSWVRRLVGRHHLLAAKCMPTPDAQFPSWFLRCPRWSWFRRLVVSIDGNYRVITVISGG